MTASRNRVCLACGDDYHCCASCGLPDWSYAYCSEPCWSSSARAKACESLGRRLRKLLTKEEVSLLRLALEDAPCYLDKVAEGISREDIEDDSGTL